MRLEVITPEKKLFDEEVLSVSFPGLEGSFQVLDNHVPIISALSAGKIKVDLKDGKIDFDSLTGEVEVDPSNSKVVKLTIKGGVVEMKNNHVIVLAD
ncbi:MAG: F0F1 ATP synthase subunit epsilon [Crocinitomicaceae bacterium]|nr:F0F1 ATP synthase subunit epsilon [Crocinitomicaceae bacterium]